MKRLFSIIFLFSLSFSVIGQHTTPRFGTAPNQDNTGRVLTYNYQTYTFVSGVDSLKLVPNAFETFVNAGAMTDSLTIKFSNVKSSYVGDQVTIYGSGSGASRKLKFDPTNCSVGVTLTAASSKYVSIKFVFDGAKWIEVSRFTQP